MIQTPSPIRRRNLWTAALAAWAVAWPGLPAAMAQAPAAIPAPPLPQHQANAPGPPIRVAALRPIEGGKKIAEVGSQVVLASDLIWQVNQLLAASADRIPPGVPPHVMEQLREQAMKGQLNAVLTTKLILNDLHASIPPEGIANVEEHLADPFEEQIIPDAIERYEVKSRAELDAKLREEGGSIDLLRQGFLDSRLVQMWLSEQTSDSSEITRDELQREYERRLSEYEYPAKVRWQELQVRIDRFGGHPEGARAAAYRELANMGNQVKEHEAGRGGAPLEVVAKARSHGLTASEGGVHDWTAKGSLVAEQVDAALFSRGLPVGRLSKIIVDQDALYIVRVLERTPAGRIPFEEAQAKIREDLITQRRNRKQREYLDKLRKEVRIWTIYTGPTTADEYTQYVARLGNESPQERRLPAAARPFNSSNPACSAATGSRHRVRSIASAPHAGR